jgi:hypothetical protein
VKDDREDTSPGSDSPADLVRQREEVLRSFVKKGVELTEELIVENAQLQERITKLEAENTSLRAHVASDDAIRELLKTIERLENERHALVSKSDELEQQKRHHEGRYREIEQELNDLASLYVASHQLSATLRPRRVVRHMCELLEQLVGCQSAVIYVIDADGQHAAPVASVGMTDTPGRLSLAGGMVGDACLTGVARIRDLPAADRGEEPIAVIPLRVGEQAVAVITVLEMLPHKESWAAVDYELFNLLSQHGPSALVAATLYDPEHGAGVLSGLETILDGGDPRGVVSRSGKGASDHG